MRGGGPIGAPTFFLAHLPSLGSHGRHFNQVYSQSSHLVDGRLELVTVERGLVRRTGARAYFEQTRTTSAVKELPAPKKTGRKLPETLGFPKPATILSAPRALGPRAGNSPGSTNNTVEYRSCALVAESRNQFYKGRPNLSLRGLHGGAPQNEVGALGGGNSE